MALTLMMRRLAYIFTALLLLSFCQTSKVNLTDPDKNGKVVMSIERTPCFGSCPVYDATLYSNGVLIYHAKHFTMQTGCFYAQVSKSEMAKMRGWFKDAGFFNLKDAYPEQDIAPTDLPSCTLTYNEAKKQKTIVDKNWNTPDPLINLERKLDTWINIQNLQSCDK
jgi:hypothetical protein